jgi:hypothetical protein
MNDEGRHRIQARLARSFQNRHGPSKLSVARLTMKQDNAANNHSSFTPSLIEVPPAAATAAGVA